MALFENGLKIGTPALIGIGALILAPVIAPAVGSAIRPLSKAVIKSGLLIFQKGKELIAGAAEAVEDLAAEIKAELIAERAGPAAGVQTEESPPV
jgi:hypothetical protein